MPRRRIELTEERKALLKENNRKYQTKFWIKNKELVKTRNKEIYHRKINLLNELLKFKEEYVQNNEPHIIFLE